MAAFRLRLDNLIPTQAWDDLWQAQHDRAFMVAGATKADLLADLALAVDKAITEGTGIEAFRRDFRALVESHGWHGWTGEGTKAGEAWRTRVIYRTNMRTSYAAGRMAQLREAGFRYWIYRHGGSMEPRQAHLAIDGLILPSDHPFWDRWSPPNGWGCSCYVVGAHTMRAAQRRGGKPDVQLPEGWDDPAPEGIDTGWAYAPGASVADLITTMAQKLRVLPATIGADLMASAGLTILRARAEAFDAFVTRALSNPPRGEHFTVGALKPHWIAQAQAAGVTPHSAEITVLDRNIAHTFRDAKVSPLDLGWYRQLPQHLLAPDLVLLEARAEGEPAFLMFFNIPGSHAKIVIRLNYRVKKLGMRNVIQTGSVASDRDIASLIGRGAVIIEGSV
ncbi:MAG: phage minor head protein [Paracoccaceae bacterium]